MPFMNTHGNRFYYLEQGQGQPVLLLHGFTGSASSWAPLFEGLSHTSRIYALDLPGHGQTQTHNELQSISTIAEDICTFIENLYLEPVNLIGYSMGGRLALFLAIQYPEYFHSVVLESASPGLASQSARQERIVKDEQWILLLESEGIKSFVDQWQNLPIFKSQHQANPQLFHQQRLHRLNNSPTGLANSLRWMGTGAQPSLWSRLNEIPTPTLLLVGDMDQKFIEINKTMLGQIPNAQLEIVPSAGHNVHFEQPGKYIDIVGSFLKNGNQLTNAEEKNKEKGY